MFDSCMYFNTAALARKLDAEWAKAFEPFQLTVPQAFMLRAILDAPGLLPRELADAMIVSRPTITRALDKLQEKGLIFRQPLDLDGRELQIHATRAGVAIKAPLNDAAAKVSARLKKLIGHADFADTVDRVVAVRNALK